MQNTVRIYLTLFLLFAGTTATCQNIAFTTLSWSSESFLEMHSNSQLNVATAVKTVGSDIIEFVREGNNLSFDIISIEGTWANVSQPGSIIYHVTYQDQPGLIKFEKNSEGVFITIDFTGVMAAGMHQRVAVTTVSSIQ